MGIKYNTFSKVHFTDNNHFINLPPEDAPLPKYEEICGKLPAPVWSGREDVIACYDYAWKTAFGNLRRPEPGTGFVTNFIDTAFNGNFFMWDTAFISMYGRYAARFFNFQKSLDNFYSHQYPNGFICRELWEHEKGEAFHMYDPSSTGPNIIAWSEWLYFEQNNDLKRLGEIFDPLLAYHLWMKENRTWKDGSYFTSGWGCGMDNMPRLQPGYDVMFSHGHMTWVDACFQAIISANNLLKMADILGRNGDVADVKEEAAYLTEFVNERLWDEETSFYYDMWKDGRLNKVKTIGSYWALLADVVPVDRLPRFIAHLNDPEEFNRPHRVPTISADTPGYDPGGDYWRGSIWAPTNYMVLKGLERAGYFDLAHEIGKNHLENVVKVFRETGTLWENYAPEKAERGSHSNPNFVGWTGLVPIAVLFEDVFGIRTDSNGKKIIWDVNLKDEHGIIRYPFEDRDVDLICAGRPDENERPAVKVKSTKKTVVEVRWNGESFYPETELA